MRRSWWIIALLAAVLVGTPGVKGDPPPKQRTKPEVVADVRQWVDRLTEGQLLRLPDRNTDEFRSVLSRLAEYADGPRDHVNDYLRSAGYPVDDQNAAWRDLAPATKIALAAKQAYVKSERDGQLFGALLARRLAADHPALARAPGVDQFLRVQIREGERPQFSTERTAAELARTPLPPGISAESIIQLASYVSSAGAVTEADLARMTPLSPAQQLEIIVSARNGRELVTALLNRSAQEFSSRYVDRDANLATSRLFAEWMKAATESYPALRTRDGVLAWVDLPAMPRPSDGGLDRPGGGGGGGGFTPRTRSGIPPTPKDGGTGRPGVGLEP